MNRFVAVLLLAGAAYAGLADDCARALRRKEPGERRAGLRLTWGRVAEADEKERNKAARGLAKGVIRRDHDPPPLVGAQFFEHGPDDVLINPLDRGYFGVEVAEMSGFVGRLDVHSHQVESIQRANRGGALGTVVRIERAILRTIIVSESTNNGESFLDGDRQMLMK